MIPILKNYDRLAGANRLTSLSVIRIYSMGGSCAKLQGILRRKIWIGHSTSTRSAHANALMYNRKSENLIEND